VTGYKFQDDPRALKFPCPACGAKAGEPCSTVTNTGRRDVRWLHLARTDKLAEEI